MKIQLDLRKHCIETELKRRHNLLISQYFKVNKQDAEMEMQIEKIGEALKVLDFSYLRSRFQDLAGNSQKEILFCVDEKVKTRIVIDGEEINHQSSS